MDGTIFDLNLPIDDEQFQRETEQRAKRYLASLPKIEITLKGWFGPSAVTEMIDRVDEATN